MGIAAAIDAFWFEHFFIEVNEYFLNSENEKSDHIKVVQISDLHLNSISSHHRRLADRLNRLKPDLILFTGDSIDDGAKVPMLEEFLSLIDTQIKRVAILGNWEYWGKVDLNGLRRVYERQNCDLLINESKQYLFRDKSISITGVDDYIGGKSDIELALETYKKSNYHIVLNHCPEYSTSVAIKSPRDINTDLILSGHTHGGQVNIMGIIPFLPQGSGKYVRGWYKHKGMNMYVSKGIGTSLLPIRFGARAEIAIFNI